MKRTLSLFQSVIQGKLIDGVEYLIQRKDGSKFPGFINMRLLSGNKPGLAGYIFDLSKTKKRKKNYVKARNGSKNYQSLLLKEFLYMITE